MGFSDWFPFGSKKINNIGIAEGTVKGPSPAVGANCLSTRLPQANAPTKVLIVQDGEYLKQVTDYALKIAGRLDCEIIALDVSEKPNHFSGERKALETEKFMDIARNNAETFTSQASALGIKVEHIMNIGVPEEIIASVSAGDAGIRYVLSKPEEESQSEQEVSHVPVFDLHCSRL